MAQQLNTDINVSATFQIDVSAIPVGTFLALDVVRDATDTYGGAVQVIDAEAYGTGWSY